MGKSIEKVRRRQLDSVFAKLRKSTAFERPKKGWIHEIRIALGMSSADLAQRMKVIRQRVDRLERDEANGKVTLESVRKAAEALDCEFIYFVVPKISLTTMVKDQAFMAAKKIAGEVEHTMRLEDQGTSNRTQSAIVEELAIDLLARNDRRIWKIK